MDQYSSLKLTCIVSLNDDYEGGEFKFFDGKTIEQKPGRLIIHPAFAGHQGEFKFFDGKTIEQKPGRLIIHPAFAGHQITEITKGKRYSCVAWAVGDTFV